MIPRRIDFVKRSRETAAEIPASIDSSVATRVLELSRALDRGGALLLKFKFTLIFSAHEGQAAAARAHQCEHVLYDAAVGRRVLDHLGMEVRAGRGARCRRDRLDVAAHRRRAARPAR